MISLFVNSVLLYKSFYVDEIWNFIDKNPDLNFTILKNYEIISNSDLCKLYLIQAKKYKDYIKIENILNKTNSNAIIQELADNI